ncbi:aspartate aminotransferase, partial [Trifolium pratense]
YLPIEGLNAFNKATAELLHGADNPAIKQHRVATVQGLSGSGSLLLGAALIEQYFPGAKVLISNPTWDVITRIFSTMLEYHGPSTDFMAPKQLGWILRA